MRVVDLFEKKLDIVQSKGKTSGLLRDRNLTYLGSGMQAIAYMHKKFPSKVIKTVNISGSSDPVYQFLRICINHSDNPYFPKIYAYKQYITSGDEDGISYADFQSTAPGEYPPEFKDKHLIIVMERLFPLDANIDLSIKALQQCSILPNDILSALKQVYPDADASNVDPLWLIGNTFDDPTKRKIVYNRTKDPHLKQALRLMEPLFANFTEDLHSDNIMLRLGPTPHPVFIDPVVF
jgi:hypothetical protein